MNISAPASCASLVISTTGLIVPTMFEAYPTATTLVFEDSFRFKSSRSSVQSSSRMSTCRITTPFSSSARHGATLPSWSSVVTTISSPTFSSRPIARAQCERYRRHVLSKDHFFRHAVEKIRQCLARSQNGFIGAPAGFEDAIRIRIRMQHVILDRLHHLPRHLGACRAIEKRRGMAVRLQFQRGKLLPHPVDVEMLASRRAHFSSLVVSHSEGHQTLIYCPAARISGHI